MVWGIGLRAIRLSRVLLVVITALAMIPAAALGHRRATKAERGAVLAAVVRQHQLSQTQANCQVVMISTVDRHYAALRWPARLSRACSRVAADGVIIEHLKRSRWHLVTAGSSFRCPIRGIPSRVARDLGVCF